MTWISPEMFVTLLGGGGFLATVGGGVKYLNTRKAAKTKDSADAYIAWRAFTAGAFEDRDKEIERNRTQRDLLYRAIDALVDLAQEMITQLRRHGAAPGTVDLLQDRLDEARRV